MNPAIISLCFALTLISNIYSYDSTAAKYYPLVIGNVYVYREAIAGPGGNSISYYKRMFTKDSIFNGHKYFKLVTIPDNTVVWKRLDSATNCIMNYDPNAGSCVRHPFESMADSLASTYNSISYRGCLPGPVTTCNDTSNTVIFGLQTKKKGFTSYSVASNWRRYIKNVGYYGDYFALGGSFHTTASTDLIGCVLNGIVLGDTTMPVGIIQTGVEISKDYKLNQNFPNPFNPLTSISFSIIGDVHNRKNHVILKIYNVSGKEMVTLVNERLSQGSYRADWDAGNFPSGLYIYKLEVFTNKLLFTESKKMILLK